MTRKTCGIDYKQSERLDFGGDYCEDSAPNVAVHIVETEKTKGSDLEKEAYHIGAVINDLISSKTLVVQGKKRDYVF